MTLLDEAASRGRDSNCVPAVYHWGIILHTWFVRVIEAPQRGNDHRARRTLGAMKISTSDEIQARRSAFRSFGSWETRTDPVFGRKISAFDSRREGKEGSSIAPVPSRYTAAFRECVRNRFSSGWGMNDCGMCCIIQPDSRHILCLFRSEVHQSTGLSCRSICQTVHRSSGTQLCCGGDWGAVRL